MVGLLSAVLVSLLLILQGNLARQRQELVGVLQSAPARTLSVTYRGEGFGPSLVGALAELDVVEYVVGLGAGRDARNASLPSREPVVLRPALAVGWDVEAFSASPSGLGGSAITIGGASERLGLRQGIGAVQLASGVQWNVAAEVVVPDGYPIAGPAILVPATASERLETIVVRVRSTSYLDDVRAVVIAAASGADGSAIQITESQSLTEASARLTQLGRDQDRTLTVGAIGISVGLNAALGLYVVTARRRDFGRKRALGASSSQILTMTAIGHVAVSLLGSIIGFGVALGVGAWVGIPSPPLLLVTAAISASTGAGLVGILPPALVAASRSPLAELRRP